MHRYISSLPAKRAYVPCSAHVQVCQTHSLHCILTSWPRPWMYTGLRCQS